MCEDKGLFWCCAFFRVCIGIEDAFVTYLKKRHDELVLMGRLGSRDCRYGGNCFGLSNVRSRASPAISSATALWQPFKPRTQYCAETDGFEPREATCDRQSKSRHHDATNAVAELQWKLLWRSK